MPAKATIEPTDPTLPENRICTCTHTEDRHVQGHNVKHCKGATPVPGILADPCLCIAFNLYRTK